jgi:hypothetical protein
MQHLKSRHDPLRWLSRLNKPTLLVIWMTCSSNVLDTNVYSTPVMALIFGIIQFLAVIYFSGIFRVFSVDDCWLWLPNTCETSPLPYNGIVYRLLIAVVR